MSARQTRTETVTKLPAIPLHQLPKTLVNRRWWWTTILVIVGMVVLARLGFWQLDRLEQRRARNAEFVQQISAPPLLLDDQQFRSDLTELRDRPAEAHGRFDFSQQLILTQQRWRDEPGAHLVTPLLIGDGERAVLVDRGWIPAAEVDAGNLEQFDEPDVHSVTGVIQLSQTLSGGRKTVVDGPEREWYRVDIEAIQEQMPYELLPIYLLQSPPESIQQKPPFRVEPDIELTDGPHLSYAIQWFIFAVLLGAGYARYVSVHR